MQKFTSFPNLHSISSSTIKSLFSFFSSLPKTQNPNSVFLNYLIESFNFSESRALALSNKYSSIKSLEKPKSVCQFLKNIGFSDAQIQSTVRESPQILVYDVDKNLKPKIEYFQNLGVAGSDLGKLISKNSLLLSASLEKKLIPCIEILKHVLVDDKNNEYLIRTLSRCNRFFGGDPNSRLLSNIEYLKTCGIVGSHLSMLLTRQPRFFLMLEFKLKKLVLQISDMGFSINSRMFVHGLDSYSCLNEEAFMRKLELFSSYGFSKDELVEMFKKVPALVRTSEEKLKSGLEFFSKKLGLEKGALCNAPLCLVFSMENRVIPRYKVFKILMSRNLLKKNWTFLQVLALSDKIFLKKFVFSFENDAEELLLAYKGQCLGSPPSSSPEQEA